MRQQLDLFSVEIDGVKIRMEDLSPELQEIAETIGLRPLIDMLRRFGGRQIYLPQWATLVRSKKRVARDAAIRAAFTGNNHSALSQKFGITPKRVREILNQKP